VRANILPGKPPVSDKSAAIELVLSEGTGASDENLSSFNEMKYRVVH
jgi:hypothetical protein